MRIDNLKAISIAAVFAILCAGLVSFALNDNSNAEDPFTCKVGDKVSYISKSMQSGNYDFTGVTCPVPGCTYTTVNGQTMLAGTVTTAGKYDLQAYATLTVDGKEEKTLLKVDQIYVFSWFEFVYDGNGGSGDGGKHNGSSIDEISSHGRTIELLSNMFTYSGHTFAGWKINGTLYQPGDSYVVPANTTTTAYALWTEDSTPVTTYKVSFNVDGGSSCTDRSTTQGGSIALPTTSKTGCTFLGWYASLDGDDKIGDAGDSYTPTGSVTLYAHWSQITEYTVTFNPNGGSVSDSKVVVNAGTEITLPSATKDGSSFTGWFTSASGGTSIGTAGDSYTPTGSVTLYAHWSTWEVTINGPMEGYLFNATFSLNGVTQSNVTGQFTWYLDGSTEPIQSGSSVRCQLTSTPSVGEHTIKVVASLANSSAGEIQKVLTFTVSEDPTPPADNDITLIIIIAGIITGIIAVIVVTRII